ncbi:uncharacterized protein LOC142333903 isoform X2 [Lycorma delicatula]|uniref:uncharacterized protein LOC142333903 isoform X2 n=1 Tax=Lycorma delicatula TaxID=130591 RepID=UPI003F513F30
MNGPVNNTLINEALPLNKNIKLDTKQYNVAETICVFLPHHITETDASSEHQVHLVQPKEKMVDMINSDIPKDPLEIEEINLVESKNIKVEIEVDSEISLNNEVLPHLNLKMETNELEINDLHTVKTEEVMEFSAGHQINLVHLKEEPLDIMNGSIEKDPLAIEDTNKSENLKVENEVVRLIDFEYSGTQIIQMELARPNLDN